MPGVIKRFLKQGLASGFQLGQKLGFDVLPRHFYSEIPHLAELRRSSHWRKPLSLVDIAGAEDLEGQIGFVRQLVSEEVSKQLEAEDVHYEASRRNGETGYGKIEAQCLYAFVYTLRPSKIVQIGCGVSTSLCQMAAEAADYQPEITCVEPYPTDFLLRESAAGRIQLIEEQVQALPLDFFSNLDAGDLFFVDSTHTLGPAGEVTRIVSEMLPRIRPGVFVHFHDIWFPYDYAPTLLSEPLFFWHETALLAAFLSGNQRYRIEASLAQLHFLRTNSLQEVFVDYKPAEMEDGLLVEAGDYPTSIYLRKTD